MKHLLNTCEVPAFIIKATGNGEEGEGRGEEGNCPKGASVLLVFGIHCLFMSEPRC